MDMVWPSNMLPKFLQELYKTNNVKAQVLLVQALESSWAFRVV